MQVGSFNQEREGPLYVCVSFGKKFSRVPSPSSALPLSGDLVTHPLRWAEHPRPVRLGAVALLDQAAGPDECELHRVQVHQQILVLDQTCKRCLTMFGSSLNVQLITVEWQ